MIFAYKISWNRYIIRSHLSNKTGENKWYRASQLFTKQTKNISVSRMTMCVKIVWLHMLLTPTSMDDGLNKHVNNEQSLPPRPPVQQFSIKAC